jgi:mono/diheme cytochrome c family protein
MNRIALAAFLGFASAAGAQTIDPAMGRRLAESVCIECHQIDAASPRRGSNSDAPSFVDIARMPSTTELAIKVFLRTPHPTMPNFVLTADEIDSVTAYILGLGRK